MSEASRRAAEDQRIVFERTLTSYQAHLFKQVIDTAIARAVEDHAKDAPVSGMNKRMLEAVVVDLRDMLARAVEEERAENERLKVAIRFAMTRVDQDSWDTLAAALRAPGEKA